MSARVLDNISSATGSAQDETSAPYTSSPQPPSQLNQSHRDENDGRILGTMNGQVETSAPYTNSQSPLPPSQLNPGHRDENDGRILGTMGNGTSAPYIDSPQPPSQLNPGHRDENDGRIMDTMGNGTFAPYINSPQPPSQLNTSHRDENSGRILGAMGNGTSAPYANSPQPPSQLNPGHRDENDGRILGTTGNGQDETPALLTNSAQVPEVSINNNQNQGSQTTLTNPTPKKRKWFLSRRLWCLIAMIIALSLGLPLGFALRIRDFLIPLDQSDLDNSTILLTAVLVDIDPRLKTMRIDWQVDNATCHSHPCEVYDIFFDNSLLVSGSTNYQQTNANNSIPKTPLFSIDSSLMDSIAANTPAFTTEVSMVPSTDNSGKGRSLQSYPFDRYFAEIFVFAKKRNDSSNGLENSIPISIDDSWGIAAGFMTDVTENRDNLTYILLDVDISRGIEVQIYAVVIIIAIWMVTLVLLSATVSAIFLGHRIAKEVLLIPVATLFAFTSLRGTLPGAPQGFGAIMDYIGILPCLSILTFCAVLHVGVFLIRNPEKDWDDKGAKIL